MDVLATVDVVTGCEHIEFAAMDQRLGVRELGALRGVSTRTHFERLGYAGS